MQEKSKVSLKIHVIRFCIYERVLLPVKENFVWNSTFPLLEIKNLLIHCMALDLRVSYKFQKDLCCIYLLHSTDDSNGRRKKMAAKTQQGDILLPNVVTT